MANEVRASRPDRGRRNGLPLHQPRRTGKHGFRHRAPDRSTGIAGRWTSPSGRRPLGFTHTWTFDSHILWQEPYVIYSRILAATRRMKVGPMVTNPGTRDWTVTGSLFATLNEMFGDRTVCGIGRGDSALRVIGRPPLLARHPLRSHGRHQGALAEGARGHLPRAAPEDPVAKRGDPRHLDGRLRAEGAGAVRQ